MVIGAPFCLARKNKGKWKKPFVKNTENAKCPEHKKIANDQSLLVDSECEGTLLLQRNCGSCSVMFPKKVRQRGTKLTVCVQRSCQKPKVMQGIDLISGMDRLKQFGVKLDCQRDTIKVHTPETENK